MIVVGTRNVDITLWTLCGESTFIHHRARRNEFLYAYFSCAAYICFAMSDLNLPCGQSTL
jgi:hypothetical protein